MFFSRFSESYFSRKTANNIHQTLVTKVLYSPLSHFETISSGEIIDRFTTDLKKIDSWLVYRITGLLSAVLNLGSLVVIVVSILGPMQSIFLIIIIYPYYLLAKKFRKLDRPLTEIDIKVESPLKTHLSETLQGLIVIRAFGLQGKTIDLLNNSLLDQMKVNRVKCGLNRWIEIRGYCLGTLFTITTFLQITLNTDKYDPGSIGLIISRSSSVIWIIDWLIWTVLRFESNFFSLKKIEHYCTLDTEIEKDQKNFPNKITIDEQNFPASGKIEFQNISMKYNDEQKEYILKNINATINPKEKIGIVGRTGSGKTTLFKCLYRFIDIERGKILIDDIDHTKLLLKQIRNNCTIIPQDSIIFEGTVRENLDPNNLYPDEKLSGVLELVYLDKVIKKFEKGLDHVFQKGRENLSVGEKQLFCLARAILKSSKIVLLDEATSSIDNKTDHLVQQTIRTQFKDCTVLTIAHRLNTIIDSDRVMVLDNGKLVEFDKPNVLLQNKDSLFYKLVQSSDTIKKNPIL